MKLIEEYRKEIIKVLKSNKLYSRGLDFQVNSLASAMRNLDLANKDIDGLETTTVLEKTKYGEKLAPHPVFKIAKESQELITRQMKVLGLTCGDLAADEDDDPLVNLTKKLIEETPKPREIVRPE